MLSSLELDQLHSLVMAGVVPLSQLLNCLQVSIHRYQSADRSLGSSLLFTVDRLFCKLALVTYRKSDSFQPLMYMTPRLIRG